MNSYFLKVIVSMTQSVLTPTAQYGNFPFILINFCINRRRRETEKCLVHPCRPHVSDIRPKGLVPSPLQEPVLCPVLGSYSSQLAVMIGTHMDKIPHPRVCGSKRGLCYPRRQCLRSSWSPLCKKAPCDEPSLKNV